MLRLFFVVDVVAAVADVVVHRFSNSKVLNCMDADVVYLQQRQQQQ